MRPFLLLLSLFSLTLFAEAPAPTNMPGEFPFKEESSFTLQLLNMLATLGLLVALVFLASWALKRMMRTRMQQVNVSSAIKILEQRSLTSKTLISVIQIRGKEIAIAESANGVTLLTQSEKTHE